MQTFDQFYKEGFITQHNDSFILSPSGKFTWDTEHANAAATEFRKLKDKNGRPFNFNQMLVPVGEDLQQVPFEKFLQQKGYAWGRLMWTRETIKLFPFPQPTERQIKAVEDFALENALKADIESITARKIKFIAEKSN